VIRASTALWAAAVIVTGYAMFQVKYEVMQQEDQLAGIKHQIADSREATRVLKAEWSFLTQPARLSTLSKRYLTLVPIGTAALGTIAAIPLRQPPDAAAPAQAVPAPPPLPAIRPGAELAHFVTSAPR
jgi:hypothetical protein